MSDAGTPKQRSEEKLPIIGRERALIDGLANRLYNRAKVEGDYTALRETPRGCYFEVKLADGRIAKVAIELDRVVDHV